MSDTTNTQSDIKSGLVTLPKNLDDIKDDISSKKDKSHKVSKATID